MLMFISLSLCVLVTLSVVAMIYRNGQKNFKQIVEDSQKPVSWLKMGLLSVLSLTAFVMLFVAFGWNGFLVGATWLVLNYLAQATAHKLWSRDHMAFAEEAAEHMRNLMAEMGGSVA